MWERDRETESESERESERERETTNERIVRERRRGRYMLENEREVNGKERHTYKIENTTRSKAIEVGKSINALRGNTCK